MDVYERIARAAESMQDLRDDAGHAESVTAYAKQLCRLLGADERIVIPAAILHDIGYCCIDREKLRAMMAKKISQEEEDAIKWEHMRQGMLLGKRILEDVGYPEELTTRIVAIIEKHDSSAPCVSIEERIVRDADKLWRFSEKGVATDVRRRGCDRQEWIAKLEKNIEKKGYFQTEEAKRIAMTELKDRMGLTPLSS